ncbi:MAG: ATP-grasp domain-containing protein [Pseudomonadota bacterium]
MKKKHILIVGGRDHTLDKADKLGLRYSMIQQPALFADRQMTSSCRYLLADYQSADEVFAVARAWHAIDPFDAIVSFAEFGMYAASLCAVELGLPGANLNAVVYTRDKIMMRDLQQAQGRGGVAYQLCETVSDASAFLQRMDGKPIILKPFSGGGSAGVSYVPDAAALEAGWEWSRGANGGTILAEEYLDGPEFSVESISRHGQHEIVMITEKITTDAPHFIELGHQVPARLSPSAWAEVSALVLDFLALVKQDTAPAHTEIRLTSDGPKIIESQTRIGGDQIWEMAELVSGVDLMGETMAALLDLPAPPRAPQAAAAAIRFFALENCHVTEVANLEQAAQAEGVLRLRCELQAGQEIGPLTCSDSRQGYVLCTGDTVDAAMRNAEHARVQVRIETR